MARRIYESVLGLTEDEKALLIKHLDGNQEATKAISARGIRVIRECKPWEMGRLFEFSHNGLVGTFILD